MPHFVQAKTGSSQETGRITAYAIAEEGEYVYIVGEAVNAQGASGEVNLDLSGGMKDIYLTKLHTDGMVVFTAIIGGSDDDAAFDVAVKEGVVYILGETWSVDFPGAPGNAGENDALLVALAADGSGILWARRFGGSDQDSGRAMKLYGGSLYLTGISWSKDLLPGASLGDADGFLASVGLDGQLAWLKIFGGGALDAPFDLMVSEDNLWVAGQSYSRNFGGTHQGEGDAFVARFNLAGVEQFARLYGGREADAAYALSPGFDGGILLAGGTRTDNLSAEGYAGNYDGFLMSIAEDGDILRTGYIGGTGVDYTYHIERLPDGYVILIGETYSPVFPLGYDQSQNNNGESDAFIVQFNPDGEIVRSLLKGGSGVDFARDAVLTSNGLWLAGKFDIGDLPYGLLVLPSELGLVNLPTDEPNLPTATSALTATLRPTETPAPTSTATPIPTFTATPQATNTPTSTAHSTEGVGLTVIATSTGFIDETSEADSNTQAPASTGSEELGIGEAVETAEPEIDKGDVFPTGWVVGGALFIVIVLGISYYLYHRKK